MRYSNLNTPVDFGKYRGKLLKETLTDIDYWLWVLANLDTQFSNEVFIFFQELIDRQALFFLDNNFELNSEDPFWIKNSSNICSNYLNTLI